MDDVVVAKEKAKLCGSALLIARCIVIQEESDGQK
jgi:hypothetical protein